MHILPKSQKIILKTVSFCFRFIVFLMYYELSYNLKHLSGDRYLNMFLSGLVDLAAMLSVIFVLTLYVHCNLSIVSLLSTM